MAVRLASTGNRCCARAPLRAQIRRLLRHWFQESVAALRPEYGIGYYRRRSLGSGLYATGLGLDSGGPPEESADEIHHCHQWGLDAMPRAVWRQGILRDVYPWNL